MKPSTRTGDIQLCGGRVGQRLITQSFGEYSILTTRTSGKRCSTKLQTSSKNVAGLLTVTQLVYAQVRRQRKPTDVWAQDGVLIPIISAEPLPCVIDRRNYLMQASCNIYVDSDA